jgi:glutaminyl-tRNA synthetase
MYDRLFTEPHPDGGDRDYRESLNPAAKRVARAFVEPSLATAQAESHFQFERHGYFVADKLDHRAGHPVFNLAVTLKDSWGNAKK